MQLDEEALPLERDLPDLRPGEGVDFGVVLEHDYAHVGHSQVERDVLVVLRRVHLDAVQLAPAGRFEEVEVGLGRRLPSEIIIAPITPTPSVQ